MYFLPQRRPGPTQGCRADDEDDDNDTTALVILRNFPLYYDLYDRNKKDLEAMGIFCTRVGTLIVATIYLQLIQNRYMFRSFIVLQCSHQHCVQPVDSDVEVVGYL